MKHTIRIIWYCLTLFCCQERTFSLVMSSYQEVAGYLENLFEQSNNLPPDRASLREALYVSAQKEIDMKKILCARALANISQVRDASENVVSIVRFKMSPGKHYDLTWISRDVVQASTYTERDLFGMFERRTNEFLEAVEAIEGTIISLSTNHVHDKCLYISRRNGYICSFLKMSMILLSRAMKFQLTFKHLKFTNYNPEL